MRKSIELSIKNPCTEDFNTFSKTNKGAFCNSCTKEVIDFTTMSSEEIQKYFSTTKHTTCGRFNKSQLKTYTEPLTISQPNRFNFFGAISLTAIALFFSVSASGQNDNTTIQTEKTIQPEEKAENKNIFSVSGIIYSKGDGFPIPGANVVLKNSIRGTDTDFDGNFKLDGVKVGDILVIHFIGFDPKTITINYPTNSMEIYLEEDKGLIACTFVGEVDTKQHYNTNRNFFQLIKSIF